VEKAKAYHHGALRQALMAEAISSLEKDGLEGLSLRALAQAVGVSKTAPYRHFEDKQALLVALAAEGFRMFADALEAGFPGATSADASPEAAEPSRPVSFLLHAYLDFAHAHPALYGLMFSRLGYALHSETCRLHAERAFGCLARAVAEAQAAGWRSGQEPGGLALSVWAQAHGWAGLVNDGLIVEDMMGSAENPALLAEAIIR
jgi:AcrR family transcriptional regulator